MLQTLSIRNIVLVDALDIDFEAGLCVLTGETGAGKSILLDALGLALGARAESRLLRSGASTASVTAIFSLPSSHSLWQHLEDQGIAYETSDIIFRRVLEADGKSKCFLNDQVISQNLMRRLGQELVEIHGQFDQLLQAKFHLAALDTYGKIKGEIVQKAFKDYAQAKECLTSFQQNVEKSFERATFLHFAIEEIEKIDPRSGEEESLEIERSLIAHRARVAEALLEVDQNISTSLSGLFQSHKALSRIQGLFPEKVNPLIEATNRAVLEAQDVLEEMKILRGDVEGTSHSLETLENRLYALKSLSRKYQTENLISCLAEFKAELSLLTDSGDHLVLLEEAVLRTRTLYLECAQGLSEMRKKTALTLQTAIVTELPPLRLEHATFRVNFREHQEENWGPLGVDQVEFYIRTNPGMPEGPLSAIASGGELSRLMLALKVVLVQSGAIPTLIFDEIESGTGGAVAAAMGERLNVLSQNTQILAITHSPQIASQGSQHFVVLKVMEQGQTTTHVKTLHSDERYEEIARMLSGEEITEEARAAAKRLIRD